MQLGRSRRRRRRRRRIVRSGRGIKKKDSVDKEEEKSQKE